MSGIWVLLSRDFESSFCPALLCNSHLLELVHFLCTITLGRCLTNVAFLTSWDIYSILDLTFTDSCNGLSWLSWRDSLDNTKRWMTSVAPWNSWERNNGLINHPFFITLLFTLWKLSVGVVLPWEYHSLPVVLVQRWPIDGSIKVSSVAFHFKPYSLYLFLLWWLYFTVDLHKSN